MAELQMSNPAFYQAVTTSLNVEQQTALMSVMAQADEENAVTTA